MKKLIPEIGYNELGFTNEVEAAEALRTLIQDYNERNKTYKAEFREYENVSDMPFSYNERKGEPLLHGEAVSTRFIDQKGNSGTAHFPQPQERKEDGIGRCVHGLAQSGSHALCAPESEEHDDLQCQEDPDDHYPRSCPCKCHTREERKCEHCGK